jgi:hypothetical protein
MACWVAANLPHPAAGRQSLHGVDEHHIAPSADQQGQRDLGEPVFEGEPSMIACDPRN